MDLFPQKSGEAITQNEVAEMDTEEIKRVKHKTMRWIQRGKKRFHFSSGTENLKMRIENLRFGQETEVEDCYREFFDKFDNNVFKLAYRVKVGDICGNTARDYFVKYEIGKEKIYVPLCIYLDRVRRMKNTGSNRHKKRNSEWDDLIGKMEKSVSVTDLENTGEYAMAYHTFGEERRLFLEEWQSAISPMNRMLMEHQELRTRKRGKGFWIGSASLVNIVFIVFSFLFYKKINWIEVSLPFLVKIILHFVPLAFLIPLFCGVPGRIKKRKEQNSYICAALRCCERSRSESDEEMKQLITAAQSFLWVACKEKLELRKWLKCRRAFRKPSKEWLSPFDIRDGLNNVVHESGTGCCPTIPKIINFVKKNSVRIQKVVGICAFLLLMLPSLYELIRSARLETAEEAETVEESIVAVFGEDEEETQSDVEIEGAAKAGWEGYRVADGVQLNIREGPGDFYQIWHSYENGEEVTVIDEKRLGNQLWYRIEYEDKDNAWINRKYLKRIYPDEIEIASITTLNGMKNFNNLCDGYLSNSVSFHMSDIFSEGGVGIIIRLSEKVFVDSFIVYTGTYFENDFDLYGKVSKIILDFGDGEEKAYDINTELDFEGYRIELDKPVETSQITMRLVDAVEGTIYKETACLEEIVVLGRKSE